MPIIDPFAGHAAGLESPISNAFAIVPDDAAELATLPRAVMLGQGGDIAVTFEGGTTVTLTGLAEGVIYPLRLRAVLATGTTATDIVGLY